MDQTRGSDRGWTTTTSPSDAAWMGGADAAGALQASGRRNEEVA
jgi:hypothetical protein